MYVNRINIMHTPHDAWVQMSEMKTTAKYICPFSKSFACIKLKDEQQETSIRLPNIY